MGGGGSSSCYMFLTNNKTIKFQGGLNFEPLLSTSTSAVYRPIKRQTGSNRRPHPRTDTRKRGCRRLTGGRKPDRRAPRDSRWKTEPPADGRTMGRGRAPATAYENNIITKMIIVGGHCRVGDFTLIEPTVQWRADRKSVTAGPTVQ